MHLIKISSVFIALVMVLAVGAVAEEPVDKKWKDEAEFMFVQTGGNTDVRTLAFRNMLEYKFSKPLIGVWNISILDTETDDVQTAERYYSDLRLDYLFTEHWYAYVLGTRLRDEFAGFDQRYTIGPGAGYKILIGPKHFLAAEAGLAYASEDYVVEEDEQFAEGRAYGKYEYHFTEKNKFLLASEYLHDFDDNRNYKSNSEAAILSALTDVLSLKVSYEVRYQNRPKPSDLEKTDTVFGAAIVVTY